MMVKYLKVVCISFTNSGRGYEVTDEDIHNPVYDLYRLTEEERKIMKEVDNSSLRTELG